MKLQTERSGWYTALQTPVAGHGPKGMSDTRMIIDQSSSLQCIESGLPEWLEVGYTDVVENRSTYSTHWYRSASRQVRELQAEQTVGAYLGRHLVGHRILCPMMPLVPWEGWRSGWHDILVVVARGKWCLPRRWCFPSRVVRSIGLYEWLKLATGHGNS